MVDPNSVDEFKESFIEVDKMLHLNYWSIVYLKVKIKLAEKFQTKTNSIDMNLAT